MAAFSARDAACSALGGPVTGIFRLTVQLTPDLQVCDGQVIARKIHPQREVLVCKLHC